MKDIDEFLTNAGRNFSPMQHRDPNYMIDHIRNDMSTAQLQDEGDAPW